MRNGKFPIFKLKLRVHEGICSDNIISVRVSIVKLMEYYVVLTVEKQRSKQNNKSTPLHARQTLKYQAGTDKPLTFSDEMSVIQKMQDPAISSSIPLISINQNGAGYLTQTNRSKRNSLHNAFINLNNINLKNYSPRQGFTQAKDHVQLDMLSKNVPTNSLLSNIPLVSVNSVVSNSNVHRKSVFNTLTANHPSLSPMGVNRHPNNLNSSVTNSVYLPQLRVTTADKQIIPRSIRSNTLTNPKSEITIESLSNIVYNPSLFKGSPQDQVSSSSKVVRSEESHRNEKRDKHDQYKFFNRLSEKQIQSGERDPYFFRKGTLIDYASEQPNPLNKDCLENMIPPINISKLQNGYIITDNSRANKQDQQQLMEDHLRRQLVEKTNIIKAYGNTHSSDSKSQTTYLHLKEELFESCLEVIESTTLLIRNFKQHIHNIRSKDRQDAYVASVMQQILIDNSNFSKLYMFLLNQVHINVIIFPSKQLIEYLDNHLSPLLEEKHIKLHVQEDFEEMIISDQNALRLVLINFIFYISTILSEHSYIGMKFSREHSSLKIQLTMPDSQNNNKSHLLANLEELMSLTLIRGKRLHPKLSELEAGLQKNQFKESQRCHVQLRVALNILKKLNVDNPNMSEYIKFSPSRQQNSHMCLTLSIPQENAAIQLDTLSQDSQKKTKSDIENSLQKELNTQRQLLLDENNNNIFSIPNFTTEDCMQDDSCSSLERWITLKQYTSRIPKKQLKLIQ